MKIKTRIQLNIILSLVLAGTTGLLLFLVVLAVNEAGKKEIIAAEGVKGVAELKIITHEYLLHPGARSLMQWQSRYDSLTKRMTGDAFKEPDEKILLDQILQNLKRVKTVFTNLTTGLRKEQRLGKQENATSRALRERLISELLLKSQAAVSLIFRLQQEIQDKLVTTQKRAALLIVLILSIFTVVIVGISLWVNKSIAKPIAGLEEGTRIIGSGNLDYRVGITATDEIGQLSRAFDKMTNDLKKTTASIYELNREIADRKKIENALKESELWMHNIFNSLEESVLVLTPDRRFVNVNEATERMFGYSKRDLANLSAKVLHIDDEHYVEFGNRIQEVFDRGEMVNIEFEVKRKNGEIFPAEHTVSMLKNNKGEQIGIVSVVRDISERKRYEEQIKTSLKEKELLLREIHHRVKNNMQVIIALLRFQSDKIKEKKYADMFKESQDRIKSMALIHEKLYQSKDFANIDFNEYAKSLVNGLFISHGVDRNKIGNKIEIEDVSLDLENAIPCGLILNEAVSNSLKYAFPEDREGEIKICLRSDNEDQIELIIGDDGVGISKEVDIRNTETLGLHLIVRLVEYQLGGEIELNRTKGTEYHIKFKRQLYKKRI